MVLGKSLYCNYTTYRRELNQLASTGIGFGESFRKSTQKVSKEGEMTGSGNGVKMMRMALIMFGLLVAMINIRIS